MDSDSTNKPVKKRGFASLTKEQLLMVSASGGRRAHALGNAHRFTVEEARAAARQRYKNQSLASNGDSQGASSASNDPDASADPDQHDNRTKSGGKS
jgi:hypothetical protein